MNEPSSPTATPDTLIQRVFLHYSECRIEASGLQIHEKTPTNQRDYFVRFEDIPTARFTFVLYRRWLIIWLICCVVSLGYLLFALTRQTVTASQLPTLLGLVGLTIGSGALVWFTRRSYIGLGTPGNAILFRANKPSTEVVSAFLDRMTQARRAFLRDTYMRFDGSEPPTALLNRLLWLKEQDAITSQEFDTLRAAHVPAETAQPSTSIGFARSRS